MVTKRINTVAISLFSALELEITKFMQFRISNLFSLNPYLGLVNPDSDQGF